MSKLLVSVFLCLAAASANALDISGIKLGSTLEEAKAIMLSLNKGYNNPKFSNMDVFTIDGAPVGYRTQAPCVGADSYRACDTAGILQGEGSAVWFVARSQEFSESKDRFPASELVASLRKKYGKDSHGKIDKPLQNSGKFLSEKYVWVFDRAGRQRLGLDILASPIGKYDLGPCNINNAQWGPNSTQGITFPTTVNETCGQYVTANFSGDENGFVRVLTVEVADIAHIYDANMRKQQAADAAQKRDADAQRAKGLKPNL